MEDAPETDLSSAAGGGAKQTTELASDTKCTPEGGLSAKPERLQIGTSRGYKSWIIETEQEAIQLINDYVAGHSPVKL